VPARTLIDLAPIVGRYLPTQSSRTAE
jgi:hypothetical protein